MNADSSDKFYVFALFPSTRGVAYVLFDSPLSIVDWGHYSIKGDSKNLKCTETVERLIERYVPDVVVLEDASKRAHPRGVRIGLLNQAFVTLAGVRGIDVVRFSSREIRKKFQSVGASTKNEQAKLIASMLPALSHKVPPKRKPWVAEDPRMALFEAAALGLAYFGTEPVFDA